MAVKFDQLKWSNGPATTGSAQPATTTKNTGRNYPDHALLNATKDQLKAMPNQTLSTANSDFLKNEAQLRLGLFMLRPFCICESSSGSSASGAITREGHHPSKSTPANRQWATVRNLIGAIFMGAVHFSWLATPARNFVAFPALSIQIFKMGQRCQFDQF